MGTVAEWTGTLFLAVFWGGAMAWFSASRRASTSKEPAWRIQDLVLLAPFALFFGIGAEFESRAFHRPLVFLLFAVLAGGCLV